MSDATALAAHRVDAHLEAEADEARTRLGMWIFLGSESLLFAGLLALYAVYRVAYPDAFAGGVDHNNRLFGTLNTAVLLTSSFTVASAVQAMRRDKKRAAVLWLLGTLAGACAFTLVKGVEYTHHIKQGMGLGTLSTGYQDMRGERIFFALYYGLTGAHALHVLVGVGLLSTCIVRMRRKSAKELSAFAELVALYWHFVDLVWILLWPLFYLTGTPP